MLGALHGLDNAVGSMGRGTEALACIADRLMME